MEAAQKLERNGKLTIVSVIRSEIDRHIGRLFTAGGALVAVVAGTLLADVVAFCPISAIYGPFLGAASAVVNIPTLGRFCPHDDIIIRWVPSHVQRRIPRGVIPRVPFNLAPPPRTLPQLLAGCLSVRKLPGSFLHPSLPRRRVSRVPHLSGSLLPFPSTWGGGRTRPPTRPSQRGLTPVPACPQAVAQSAVHHREHLASKVIKVDGVLGVTQQRTWEVGHVELCKQ